MSKNEIQYMHAVLRKGDGAKQVSWIPAEFAKEGRFLKLKENGVWTDGWEVIQTYPSILIAESIISERERDYRNHRKGTDI